MKNALLVTGATGALRGDTLTGPEHNSSPARFSSYTWEPMLSAEEVVSP